MPFFSLLYNHQKQPPNLKFCSVLLSHSDKLITMHIKNKNYNVLQSVEQLTKRDCLTDVTNH